MAKSPVEKMKLDAIPITYNDATFYITVIGAGKLFSVAKVSRADEDPDEGFQRELGLTRAKNIKRYLEEGNVIPGTLILSAQKKSKFKYIEKEKKIEFLALPNSFLVIDGQHRLYGAKQVDFEVPLPVCIFPELETEQEVQYFLDVNGFQKGVPRTLRLELLKFTAEPDSKDDIRKKLFDALDENTASPLCGKIARTKSVTGKISHVAFKSALDPLLDSSPLNMMKQENRIKVLISYLTAVENKLIEMFESSGKISNAAFFQAIMAVFPYVSSMATAIYGNNKVTSFEGVLNSIDEINWDLHKGTNKQAIKDLSEAIKSNISLNVELPDDFY